LGVSGLPVAAGCKVKLFTSPKDAIYFLSRMGYDNVLKMKGIAIRPFIVDVRRNPAKTLKRAKKVVRGTRQVALDHFAGFEGA
jgi:hypothetical protein